MLPRFKQIVEQLYLRGLCRVVFATETLALGTNMPARTVVLQTLTKWTGAAHPDLTSGAATPPTGPPWALGLHLTGTDIGPRHPGSDPNASPRLSSPRTSAVHHH